MLEHYFGETIALCTTLSWSICIFPFTNAAKRMGANPVNHFRLVLALASITIISILLFKISLGELISPEHNQWIWFGSSGIIGLALGDYFGFTAFVILGPRIASVFSSLAPAASLFTGIILIDEKINGIGVLGILITIGGVIWLNMNTSASDEKKTKEIKKGILFGVLSALCQGLGVVLANKGYLTSSQSFSYIHATWIRMLAATVTLFTITIFSGKIKSMLLPVFENKNGGIKYAVVGTFFGPILGVSLSMYAILLLHNKPSVAQTIFSMVPIFVLPLAYIFYKEKPRVKSIIGALVAVAGVVVLIWRNEIMKLLFTVN